MPLVSADPMTLKSISSLVHGAIASPVSEKRVIKINTKRLATAALFSKNLCVHQPKVSGL